MSLYFYTMEPLFILGFIFIILKLCVYTGACGGQMHHIYHGTGVTAVVCAGNPTWYNGSIYS